MKFDKEIRDLAMSFYWQKLYVSSKEINGINLFENACNFTGFQVMFLYWLEIYHSLYRDLSMKEYENLSENVIRDHRRCDAFLYWRQKDNDRKLNEVHKELKTSNRISKGRSKGTGKSYNIFKGTTHKGGI